MRSVNLAARPFINRRPVVRTAIALWLLGGLLCGLNIAFFSGHHRSSKSAREDLESAREQLAAERARVVELDAELGSLNLAEQNERVETLNTLIAYRTFPWSALFSDLESVLPRDVRLDDVQPRVELDAALGKSDSRRRGAARSGRPRTTTSGRRSETAARVGERGRRPVDPGGGRTSDAPRGLREEVKFNLTGTAKDDDALLALLDTLYADPAFAEPLLRQEALDESIRGIRFSLDVQYLTERGRERVEPTLAQATVGEGAALPVQSSAVPPSGTPTAGGEIEVPPITRADLGEDDTAPPREPPAHATPLTGRVVPAAPGTESASSATGAGDAPATGGRTGQPRSGDGRVPILRVPGSNPAPPRSAPPRAGPRRGGGPQRAAPPAATPSGGGSQARPSADSPTPSFTQPAASAAPGFGGGG